jgi:hypothetical protein
MKKTKARSSVGLERKHPELEVAGSIPAGPTTMTAADLKKAGPKLFGYGWQTRMAESLGVDGSTVRRWVSGAVPIPNPAAAAILCWLDKKQINP